MDTKADRKFAFDTIYEENINNVYKAAFHYSGNHHEAEEIAQTVFMKLYMNLDNINMNAVSAWLLVTAKHMALNYKRQERRIILCEEVKYDVKDNAGTEASTEENYIRKLCQKKYWNFAKDIFADLYRLNPRWYDALTITYLLEKPQREVADIMGVKVETLYSMLYRAKKWIKRNYKEQFGHLRE